MSGRNVAGIVLAVVFVVAMTMVTLYVDRGRAIKQLLSPEVAAWVQALGTIGAVCVAVLLGNRQHAQTLKIFQHEEEQRQKEKRELTAVHAVRISFTLIFVVESCERATAIWKIFGMDHEGTISSEEATSIVIPAVRVATISGVDFAAHVHWFDPMIAQALLNVERRVGDYREDVQGLIELLASGQVSAETMRSAVRTRTARLDKLARLTKATYTLVAREFNLRGINEILQENVERAAEDGVKSGH